MYFRVNGKPLVDKPRLDIGTMFITETGVLMVVETLLSPKKPMVISLGDNENKPGRVLTFNIDGVNYRSFDNLDELNEVIDTAYEEVELVKSIQVEGEGV